MGNIGIPEGLGKRWEVCSLEARAVGCFRPQGRLLIDARSSPRSIMSTAPPASTSISPSNFVSIFNAALDSYKRKTKKDLASHPLLSPPPNPRFPRGGPHRPSRRQVPAFSESQNSDDGLTKWVTPTVNVLQSFSETIGQGGGVGEYQDIPSRKNPALMFILRHSRRQV